METTKFGAESIIKGVEKRMVRELEEFRKIIAIIRANDGLTYRNETMTTTIQTSVETGRALLIKDGGVIGTLRNDNRKILDLFSIEKIKE